MTEFDARDKIISLAIGAAATEASETLNYEGQLKHLHLRVPNFTNSVTATVTLLDPSGYVLYTSAAKAKNANYNLETEAEWVDQLLVGGKYTLKVTLSGVPGGTGGTVTMVPRILGGKW